jgi:hypothetical protein
VNDQNVNGVSGSEIVGIADIAILAQKTECSIKLTGNVEFDVTYCKTSADLPCPKRMFKVTRVSFLGVV